MTAIASQDQRRPSRLSPDVPSARGFQTVHAYRPTENELEFVATIWILESHGLLGEGVAAQVECIQLCKVTGAHLHCTEDEAAHCHELASRYDVDPRF